MDLLAYFQLIQYTQVTPQKITILFDLIFNIFSATILVLVLRKSYNPYLKFFTISFDYAFICLMILFDPTVPKEGEIIYFISMVAAIFIFMYNLIRFSKVATIYSGIHSIVFFLTIGYLVNDGNASNVLPMFSGLLMILSVGFYITIANAKMLQEANTKMMMERFLPPQLLGELHKYENNINFSGKHQRVTILFSDIRSFTELSEKMMATEVVSLLNDYLTTMTEIIFKYEGTIDKFIGDAIMTVYGAPIPTENDEERAILTALEMLQGMESLNARHPELGQPLEIGIGIHSGDVIVGNIGSEKRLDYTVIGDNVNLSSRIEGLTKYYRCPILISDQTREALSKCSIWPKLILREVDTVTVKGRKQKVTVFQIMGIMSDPLAEELMTLKMNFESGLQFYKDGKFSEALNLFQINANDQLSHIFIQRCLDLIKNPPGESWDGVFVMQEK